MRNEALFSIVHEDVCEDDFLGVLSVSLMAEARRTIELNFCGNVCGPLAVEVADDFTSLIGVQAFPVAARGETILLEVADEASLQLLVLFWVLEERVKDSLKDLCIHVAVEQAEPILLHLYPICDNLNRHLLNIEAR